MYKSHVNSSETVTWDIFSWRGRAAGRAGCFVIRSSGWIFSKHCGSVFISYGSARKILPCTCAPKSLILELISPVSLYAMLENVAILHNERKTFHPSPATSVATKKLPYLSRYGSSPLTFILLSQSVLRYNWSPHTKLHPCIPLWTIRLHS